MATVQPRFNEHLYNEALGIKKTIFFRPVIVKCMEKNLLTNQLP